MDELSNPYSEINNPYVRRQYYDGFKNQIIRIWYYLNHGLGLMNEFKYLIGGILATYYFLKTDNLKLMIWMFVIALPILVFAGWFWTHKAKRTIEYFDIKYTTHFGQYNIRLQEKQIETLQELGKQIHKLNDKLGRLKKSSFQR